MAEQSIVKGTKFAVEGKLSANAYEVDGEKRSSVIIIVQALEVIPAVEPA